MKNSDQLIDRIVTILHRLTPGALRRVLAFAKRECTRIQRRERGIDE